MKILACAAILCSLAPRAFSRDDREGLTQAVNKAAVLESYAWKTESEFQTPLGNAPAQIPNLNGVYQKDDGIYVKSDRGEFFRKGSRTLVKPAKGDWQDLAQFRPGAPPPAGGDDKPAPNRNRGRAAAMLGPMLLRNFKAPHDELKDLAKGLKEVKKSEKTEKIGEAECFEYSGDLSEEAMKDSPLGRMLGRFGGANASVNGSAKIWVASDSGMVAGYEILTTASVEFNGNTIDLTMTRRNEITDAGKAKLVVPDAVQKLLSEPPARAADQKTEDKEGPQRKAQEPKGDSKQ